MFEKEIKFISDFSLNKIKNLGSFFTFEKIFASDLHPAIVKYLSSELDYLIHEDRKKLLQNSPFDYSGVEISKYFTQIAEEIKKTKRVSYEDLKTLIIQAVSFNINYVVRPKWSLMKLIYNEADSKPVDEILLMLNYVYYYDYIKNIVSEYLIKRKIVTLSRGEFEAIFIRMDKTLLTAKGKDLIDNALYSIAEFNNIGSLDKTRVSPSAFELYLKEKGQMNMIAKLRRSVQGSEKQKYDIEDIRSVIYSGGAIEEPPTKEPDVETENEKNAEVKTQNIAEPGKEDKQLPEEKPEKNIEENVPDESEELKVSAIEEENDEEREEAALSSPETEEKSDDSNEPEKEVKTDTEDKQEAAEDTLSAEEELELVEKELDQLKKELESFNLEDFDFEDEKDKELLSLYNEDAESTGDEDEIVPEIDSDQEEVEFELSEKEDLDSLYDFKEENSEEQFEEDQIEEENTAAETDDRLDKISGTDKSENIDDIEIDEEDSIELEELDIDEDLKKDLMEEPEEINPEEQISEDSFLEAADYEENFEETERSTGNQDFEKDLFTYLSDKEIEKIVSSVFNEDREDFATTMEKVSECGSYDEATEILKGVFFSYRVNPYSRDAVTLTNAVSNYFNQV